jgi:repressor LexA
LIVNRETRTMPKTYITDITHFLDEAGDLADMPPAARKLASFLALIIEAVTQACPTHDYATGIRCRKRGCSGSIRATLSAADEEIVWYCPSCLEQGVIRNWQGTKWDRSGGGAVVPSETAESAPKPVPGYTPKEGQYLAFIYYYTKLNRQAPGERDMQVYFRVTPPAVHDMVLKLEKHGFISREPGVPRSIRLLLSRNELPDLE